MECVTRILSVASVCLLVGVSVVTGLRCYDCLQVKFDTSSSLIDSFLNNFAQSAKCDEKVDTETPGVTVRTCPDPPTGKEARCFKEYGTTDVDIGIIKVSGTVFKRGCSEVDVGTARICEDTSVADNSITQLLTISNFKGTFCTCSSDNLCNAQTRLTSGKLCAILGLFLAVVFSQLW